MYDICLINGINLKEVYQAELTEVKTISGELESMAHQILTCSDIFLIKNKESLGKLQLKLLIEKSDTTQAMKTASKLVVGILGKTAVIKIDNDNFYGYLNNYEILDIDLNGFCWLNLEFKALRRGELITKVLTNGTGEVENIGSLESGAKLKLTAFEDVENFDVFNIHIKKLKANVPLIIDGINGSIQQDNKNAFSSIELFDFPKLKSGINQINSTKSVRLEVSYFPVDLI